MAYFPKQIMPSFPKKDAPGSLAGSNPILADSYNLHSNEIIAIEQFLGTELFATEEDENNLLSGTNIKNVIGIIRRMVDEVNVFTDGGVVTTSGSTLDGQRMIFPEQAHATFLTRSPATTDQTIRVTSTIGFPNSGVISILNDMDVPNIETTQGFVEWIKYSGKTSTEFIGCERGFLDTTVGSHNGTPALSGTFNGTANSQDQCVNEPIGLRICGRRYPGWRYKELFSFPAFGLNGTLVEVIREVRRNPESFILTKDALGVSTDRIINAATDLGILGQRRDGSPMLQSQDLTYQALRQLEWEEAENFIDSLSEATTELPTPVVRILTGADWTVGSKPFIPVFQGRMSVEYAMSALTLNPTSTAVAPTSFQSIGLVQTADGRLMTKISSDSTQTLTDQAVVQYKAFFVAALRTSQDRNAV